MSLWEQSLANLILAFEPNSEALIEGFFAADEALAAGFEANFYNQQDEMGQSWPPRKDNLPHPLLIKTGKMFRAATNTEDSGHYSDIENGTTLIVGIADSVVPYAKYHHTGTRIMPARRVIFATPETLRVMEEKFADAIEKSL